MHSVTMKFKDLVFRCFTGQKYVHRYNNRQLKQTN